MDIASKLFFDFKKEYADLDAADVKSFIDTKNYAQDEEKLRTEIEVVNVEKDGIVDYVSLIRNGVVLHNFRGDLNQNLTETVDNLLYQQYRSELISYIFTKLADNTGG